MKNVERTNKKLIEQFSSHLFWDVAREKIDAVRNKKFLVQRVLEYRLMEDLQNLKQLYGVDQIAEIAATFRSLEPKALHFIATIGKKPLSSFRVYTTKVAPLASGTV